MKKKASGSNKLFLAFAVGVAGYVAYSFWKSQKAAAEAKRSQAIYDVLTRPSTITAKPTVSAPAAKQATYQYSTDSTGVHDDIKSTPKGPVMVF